MLLDEGFERLPSFGVVHNGVRMARRLTSDIAYLPILLQSFSHSFPI